MDALKIPIVYSLILIGTVIGCTLGACFMTKREQIKEKKKNDRMNRALKLLAGKQDRIGVLTDDDIHCILDGLTELMLGPITMLVLFFVEVYYERKNERTEFELTTLAFIIDSIDWKKLSKASECSEIDIGESIIILLRILKAMYGRECAADSLLISGMVELVMEKCVEYDMVSISKSEPDIQVFEGGE